MPYHCHIMHDLTFVWLMDGCCCQRTTDEKVVDIELKSSDYVGQDLTSFDRLSTSIMCLWPWSFFMNQNVEDTWHLCIHWVQVIPMCTLGKLLLTSYPAKEAVGGFNPLHNVADPLKCDPKTALGVDHKLTPLFHTVFRTWSKLWTLFFKLWQIQPCIPLRVGGLVGWAQCRLMFACIRHCTRPLHLINMNTVVSLSLIHIWRCRRRG